MATDAGILAADAFGLLSYYGSESAGSLTLLPPGPSPAPGRTVALADADLSERLRALPQTLPTACAHDCIDPAGANTKLEGTPAHAHRHGPEGAHQDRQL